MASSGKVIYSGKGETVSFRRWHSLTGTGQRGLIHLSEEVYREMESWCSPNLVHSVPLLCDQCYNCNVRNHESVTSDFGRNSVSNYLSFSAKQ